MKPLWTPSPERAAATELAKKALETRRSVVDLVVESQLLTRERVVELLTIRTLTGRA